MAKVHSHDAFTALVMKPEASWATEPTPWSSAPIKVPFLSEDLHYDVEVFPASEEFGALGGLQSVDTGRQSVTGSITVEPTYNTPWWWVLFSAAWGTENIVSDRSIFDATTPVTNLNTHIWTPGSSAPLSLAFRKWLGGAGPAGSAYFQLILGAKVTRMVWTQPRNGRASVTFDYIAKSAESFIGTGETIPTLATATKVKAIDFTTTGSRTHGFIRLGATLADFNTMGFTLTVDRKIELDDNYLQSLLQVTEPGIVGTREVTLEIDTDLEQDWGAAGKPWAEFRAGTVSSATIGYDSGVTAVSPEEYNFKLDLPAIVWTDIRPQATQAGAFPMPLTAVAQLGPISNLEGIYGAHAIPTGNTDIRAMSHVVGTDDLDVKWSTLPVAT